MAYIFKRLRRFCSFIAGFVFFMSGILKLIDPVGAGLVMDEYFSFLHIGFLSFASKATGTLFAFAESILGAALVTGVWRKPTAIAALIFQGFFTLLTLLLLIFNPEMDCGCFGEAIHLTHFQTFLKNVILMALLLIAYIPMDDLGEPLSRKYVSFGLVVMSVTAFGLYSWTYIPMMDFTDFKPGVTLQAAEASDIQEEAYEAVFIYEKDGKTERFTLNNLPDSTWTFVDTETILKAGSNSIGLSFYDKENEYCDTLATEGKVMVISIYDPLMSQEKWEKTTEMLRYTAAAGFKPLLLTASSPELIGKSLERLDKDTEVTISKHVYFSDYKTLITLNRSNAGATYFHNGRLICKWAFRSYPDAAKLDGIGKDNEVETAIGQDTGTGLIFQGFLLYVTAIMLLL